MDETKQPALPDATPMFVGEKLIYLQLQKTGCTHIARMLAETIRGQQVGKHNRLAEPQVNRYVAGSIRNPWDWYVSLWAFGCSSRGSIFQKTTYRRSLRCATQELAGEVRRRRSLPQRRFIKQLYHEATKPVDQWRFVYADSHDPSRFRAWLQLILDPRRRADHDEHGYAGSSVGAIAGLLTYRYLRLYSSDLCAVVSSDQFVSVECIKRFDQETNVLNGIIRTESLEDDLLAVITAANYEVTDAQRAHILSGKAKKSNTSKHREASFYYDDISAQLVRDKERLLIDKYSYVFPGT